MKNNFPKIEKIEDVLPAIENKAEFIHAVKSTYQVINYVVSKSDTFENPNEEGISEEEALFRQLRRECRGLIFGVDGKIISRRYHKFFNLNEKEETLLENVDFSQPHIITTKLDGSMITPLTLNGEVHWATKMGLTDISSYAEKFVSESESHYKEFANFMNFNEMTPIFEFCSRKNKIVIDYPEDSMKLTSVRKNVTGEYLNYQVMTNIANYWKVPCVKTIDYNLGIESLLEEFKTAEGEEGIVVNFNDGQKIKLKTDWYVKIHRAKDIISRENDIAYMILNNEIDDLKSLLPKDELKKVTEFEEKLLTKVHQISEALFKTAIRIQPWHTRKEFAAQSYSPFYKRIIFSIWDDTTRPNTLTSVVKYIKDNCAKQSKYNIVKKELFPEISIKN